MCVEGGVGEGESEGAAGCLTQNGGGLVPEPALLGRWLSRLRSRPVPLTEPAHLPRAGGLCSQVAMATGQVLFHRFFYSKSFVKHNFEVSCGRPADSLGLGWGASCLRLSPSSSFVGLLAPICMGTAGGH